MLYIHVIRKTQHFFATYISSTCNKTVHWAKHWSLIYKSPNCVRHHSKWTADICVRARLSLDGRILMPPWFWRRSYDSFPVKLWIWRKLRIQPLVTKRDGATKLHGLQTVLVKLFNSYFRLPTRQTSLWLVFCELWDFRHMTQKKGVEIQFKFKVHPDTHRRNIKGWFWLHYFIHRGTLQRYRHFLRCLCLMFQIWSKI